MKYVIGQSVYKLETTNFTYNKNKTFQVAFNSLANARHVHYNMNHVKPNIRLILSNNKIDVSADILKETNMDLGHVYIDTDAKWIVDKPQQRKRTYQKDLLNQLVYCYTLETLCAANFVMLPLVKNLGIVLPYKIEDEDEHKITFASCAMYGESHFDDYRKSLEKTLKKSSD